MNIDISQFHATFLEESSEHLTDLENGLLAFDNTGEVDMSAIFRAAHSIKGGAATFGFTTIADFTHVVESVLQRCRDNEISLNNDMATDLLHAVDVIADLIEKAKGGEMTSEVDGMDKCLQKISSYLEIKTDHLEHHTFEPSPLEGESRMLNIVFKPHTNLPTTGSDPLHIIRELNTLGDVTVVAHIESVPLLEELNPEDLFLWWEFSILTDATEEEINDVFLFVEDNAEIEIHVTAGLNIPDPTQQEEAPQAEQKEEIRTATPITERRQEDRRQSDRRQPPQQTSTAPKENAYIRVAVEKVDNLINLVGELVTTNAMVEVGGKDIGIDELHPLRRTIKEMSTHTRNLQEGIMAIRMMPIDFAFSRFPRMVRDTSQKLNKKIKLVTNGAQTEMDKGVIEKITDPLTHLVRNSIDHGIESPENRLKNGKSEEGTVELNAFYRGGNVIIEIKDDGQGLNRDKIFNKAVEQGLLSPSDTISDEDLWQYIFHSGFSTAEKVSDVSGRGVGMDVVMKNIKSLGGSIHIQSQTGEGTCFSISLPLTLAIVDGMALKVGNESYILPMLNIVESIRPTKNMVHSVKDDVEVIDVRGSYIPMLRLYEAMPVDEGDAIKNIEDGITIIIEADQTQVALFVDDLLGEQQVVIKSMEDNYRSVEGVSGATILGDGSVALILDTTGLVQLATRDGKFMKKDFKNKQPASKEFSFQEDFNNNFTSSDQTEELRS